MAFGVCLPPFSLTQSIILKHSTIERSFQKPPFCVAKVWFLACKKWVFTLQKYGFCFLRECFLFFKRVFFVLQYIVPRPRTPTKWRCVGAIWQYNIYLFLGIAHLFISY